MPVIQEKVLGIKISSSRFEVVRQDSCTSYDKFYEQKPPPSKQSQGDLQVISFDGKGVPVIRRQLSELKARLGWEKVKSVRRKKKLWLVSVIQ